MHPDKKSLLWLNVIGGLAVLGSYAHGIATHPESRGALWGGVPAALQPAYSLSMLTATAGYFAYSFFVFFRLDPSRTRIAGRFGYRGFHLLYALILVPSALWMPLAFAMIESPGPLLWLAVRGVLGLTAIGSLGLLAALVLVEPRPRGPAWPIAILGALAFCIQTVLFDALVWPAFYAV